MELAEYRELRRAEATKIVLLVMDGLGGLPRETDGLTELEAAHTPNLDRLAAEGICGLHEPVAPGVTPGSGPSHLALFGYDPLTYRVGRGALSAMGIGFDLGPHDVAARGNYATVDADGRVTDRRAGRISTALNRELCARLRAIELPDAEVMVETVAEHRFLLVLRGEGLSEAISDTDPQSVGEYPLEPRATDPAADRTARLVAAFVAQAREVLADQPAANMVLLRGFARRPAWPSMEEAFGLRGAAIAAYPMYRGLARLLGMDALEVEDSLPAAVEVLERHWAAYDFFYLHAKHTDSEGEDGDFEGKVAEIERVDGVVPRIMQLAPDVIIVTGDHSTPAVLRSHSWHPVPVLIRSPYCRRDRVERFGERACMAGGLGPRIPATALIPIAVASALRLEKYGA
ncbi:MAG TPA: 2,3-bisphosphoglycerate-independent phosphoglycerate mutase [Chloroflexi bacterium]|jgi:2,3-bisphosphoglycerate-independent phosphoglycerate mutase|nr:2,3-bisphosphoglycerate-independent phosphoglycerate mutase [Chloroflexota bacterium]